MQRVKYVAVQCLISIMRLLYYPMKKLPVQKKVVMISRQSDEPSIDMSLLKARIQEKYPDTQVVILAKMLKNPVTYALHILTQMYHLATSRAVVLDSYCIPVSVLHHRESLVVIQMWHSIGSMKKFGYAMLGLEEGADPKLARLMCMHKNYTYILISSNGYLKDYIEGFQTTPNLVREIPLPRADLLTDRAFLQKRREKILQKNPWFAAKKNIFYCPTFRKKPTALDQQKIRELIDAVDFKRYNLIYKPHTVSELTVSDKRVITSHMSNVDMAAIADYVITDYSSIMYEAGICHIPVYLYTYDWEDYSEKREFNLDVMHGIPALHSCDAREILKAIEAGKFDGQAFDRFVQENFHYPETSCCEEIIKLMKLEEEEE